LASLFLNGLWKTIVELIYHAPLGRGPVVRCDGDPDDPAKSKGKESVFQFFAPIGGINAVRMGHGAAVLREIRDTYCNGSRQSIGRDRRDGKLSAGDLANLSE
jgi:hypothetical protein